MHWKNGYFLRIYRQLKWSNFFHVRFFRICVKIEINQQYQLLYIFIRETFAETMFNQQTLELSARDAKELYPNILIE